MGADKEQGEGEGVFYFRGRASTLMSPPRATHGKAYWECQEKQANQSSSERSRLGWGAGGGQREGLTEHAWTELGHQEHAQPCSEISGQPACVRTWAGSRVASK